MLLEASLPFSLFARRLDNIPGRGQGGIAICGIRMNRDKRVGVLARATSDRPITEIK